MVEAILVLFAVFAVAFVTGNLAGPNWYGARLLLLMLVSGFIGGAITLLLVIAWRL